MVQRQTLVKTVINQRVEYNSENLLSLLRQHCPLKNGARYFRIGFYRLGLACTLIHYSKYLSESEELWKTLQRFPRPQAYEIFTLCHFHNSYSYVLGRWKARDETCVVTEAERNFLTNCLYSIKFSQCNEKHEHGQAEAIQVIL
jgi:hypothetical protein